MTSSVVALITSMVPVPVDGTHAPVDVELVAVLHGELPGERA